MDSDALEKGYQSNPDKQVTFTARNQSYELSCKTMRQKNVKYSTFRDIRRRPIYRWYECFFFLKSTLKLRPAL